MDCFTVTFQTKEQRELNGGYLPIGDDGFQASRKLFITDDDGNTAVLKNEQIAELFYHIKPAMMG